MEAFSLNSAIASDSKYKCEVFGMWSTIFAVECTGANSSLCKNNISMRECDHGFFIRSSGASRDKIKALFKRHNNCFRLATDLVSRVNIMSTDYTFMCGFVRAESKCISALEKT
jgi:hypothetical protein